MRLRPTPPRPAFFKGRDVEGEIRQDIQMLLAEIDVILILLQDRGCRDALNQEQSGC